MFGEGWSAVSAAGARVVLENAMSERRSFLDFMTAYGAVNFGHCNPSLVQEPESADIVGGIYPEEAKYLARWLCTSVGLIDHEVLFQVGGSFAVATAMAIAQVVKPGKPRRAGECVPRAGGGRPGCHGRPDSFWMQAWRFWRTSGRSDPHERPRQAALNGGVCSSGRGVGRYRGTEAPSCPQHRRQGTRLRG